MLATKETAPVMSSNSDEGLTEPLVKETIMLNTTERPSTCPAWCREQHTATEPETSGNHTGPAYNLRQNIETDMGDGLADAELSRTLLDGIPGYFLCLDYQVDVFSADIENLALELEQIAATIRTVTNGDTK
jgi:hypothetical protein